MTQIIEYSNKCYSLWKKDVDFIKRGDALYWNPIAIRTAEELFKSPLSTPLSKVANIFLDVLTPKNDKEYNLIELTDVDGNSGLTKFRRVHGKDVDSNKFEFKKNDVIFGRLRFYLKKIGIAPVDGIGSTEFRVIRNFDNTITPEYIFSYLRTKYVHNILIKRDSGSNHPRLADEDLLNLPIIKLPSKIVIRITEDVKKSLSIFENAQMEIREAVSIFEKQLQFREKTGREKYFIKWKRDIQISKRLDPSYWVGENDFFKDSLKIKTIVKNVFVGKTPPWLMYSDSSGIRILKVRHLSNDGLTWDLRDRDYVNEIFYEKNKNAEVQIDDILIAAAAHQSAYIGRDISIVDCFPDGVQKAIASAKLNVIRPNRKQINPFVLLLLMQEEIFYKEIQRQIRGETGELYVDDIFDLPIPKKLLNDNFPRNKEVEKLLLSAFRKNREAKNILKNINMFLENEIEKKLRNTQK